MPVITYRDALGQAIREEMQRDDRVFLMGEEVGVYNGAYKVSKGFLQEFGEMRVVDVHLGHVRQKLGQDDLITTVRGVGYRFEDEPL